MKKRSKRHIELNFNKSIIVKSTPLNHVPIIKNAPSCGNICSSVMLNTFLSIDNQQEIFNEDPVYTPNKEILCGLDLEYTCLPICITYVQHMQRQLKGPVKTVSLKYTRCILKPSDIIIEDFCNSWRPAR